jgi:hypothetical protein
MDLSTIGYLRGHYRLDSLWSKGLMGLADCFGAYIFLYPLQGLGSKVCVQRILGDILEGCGVLGRVHVKCADRLCGAGVLACAV